MALTIDEKEYQEIENSLIRLCNTVAIPRFMKALRNAVDLELFEKFSSLKGVKPSLKDFNQEFVDWISYGNLDTNFETKGLNDYPVTRQLEDMEEGRDHYMESGKVRMITDEDIPF